MQYASVSSSPLTISRSTEAQVYGLFAIAIGLTVAGVVLGMQYASLLLSSGVFMACMIAELLLVFTAHWWIEKVPLNYLLFGLFPVFSGLTLTPLLMMMLAGYANGASILLNALSATAFMAAAAAVFAKTTNWNLGVLGRALFIGILGLLVMGLLQLFIPAFRTTQMELVISGAGVVIFAGFTAYDIQRVSQLASRGYNPIMLALSLYLDIFNLFVYVVRFMLAVSGQRR